MKKSSLWVVAVSALLLPVSALHAETIKEKEAKGKANESYEKVVKQTNDKCGSSLTASIDWSTFNALKTGGKSVAGYCEAPLDALRTLCDSAAGKEGVAKGVKHVDCKFGGTGKRAVALKDGTISYTVDWDASNNTEFVKKYLDETL